VNLLAYREDLQKGINPFTAQGRVMIGNASTNEQQCLQRQWMRSFERPDHGPLFRGPWPDPVGPGRAGRFASGRRKRTARSGPTGSGQLKKLNQY